MIVPAEVITLGVVLPTVDIVIVALRLYVKRTRVRSVDWSDYIILLSLACLCGTAVMIVYGAVAQGYGKKSPPAVNHGGVNANSSPEITVTRHLTWSFMCISTLTYGLAKLSVLLFYRTIFVGRAFRIVSISMIVITCVWTLITFLFLFFQCGEHINATWTDAAYIAEHCLSGNDIGLSASATDVFTDLAIIILPIYWVSKLQISLKKRLSVIGVFLFGALAVISSIIRLIALSRVYPTHNKNPNQFAFMTTIIYFGQLEAGLCVIAASLPTLGPLMFPNRSQRGMRSGKPTYTRASGFRSRLRFNSKGSATQITEPKNAWRVHTVAASNSSSLVTPHNDMHSSTVNTQSTECDE